MSLPAGKWLAFAVLPITLIIAALWLLDLRQGVAQAPWCNCYTTAADCGLANWPGAVCGGPTDAQSACLIRPGHSYPWSSGAPKEEDTGLDGRCYTPPFHAGPFPTPEVLVSAVRLWFDAYLGAAKDGTRLTIEDRKRISAEMMRLPLESPFPRHVKMLVEGALDATLGWDFRQDRTEPYLASIMKPRPAAVEIANATQLGIEQSILKNDATPLQRALQEFWGTHPAFVPMHQGRCYAHGHSWVTNVDDQMMCQFTEVSRLLKVLLRVETQ